MKFLRPILIAAIFVGGFFLFHHLPFRPFVAHELDQPSLTRWKLLKPQAATQRDAEEQNNISVYRKNVESVVNVTSRAVTFDFFYGLVPAEGQGSGFIIDKEGHILTNYHVIADARQVEVTLHNRKKYRATIIGTDPLT